MVLMCNFSSVSAISQLTIELEGPMKAPRSRHFLLYLDEQKNANFGQIVDRFLDKIGVATMVLQLSFFSKLKKKIASDRARRLNETCLKPPSAALLEIWKSIGFVWFVKLILVISRSEFGQKNEKKKIFFRKQAFDRPRRSHESSPKPSTKVICKTTVKNIFCRFFAWKTLIFMFFQKSNLYFFQRQIHYYQISTKSKNE